MDQLIHDLLKNSVFQTDEKTRLVNMSKAIKLLSQILPQKDVDIMIFKNKELIKYLLLSEAINPQSISMIIEALIKLLQPNVESIKNIWYALNFIAKVEDTQQIVDDSQQLINSKLPQPRKNSNQMIHEFCDVINRNIVNIKINSLKYSNQIIDKMLNDLDNIINYGHDINILETFKNFLKYTIEDKIIVQACNILEYLKKRWPSLWFNSNIDYLIEEILMSKSSYFIKNTNSLQNLIITQKQKNMINIQKEQSQQIKFDNQVGNNYNLEDSSLGRNQSGNFFKVDDETNNHTSFFKISNNNNIDNDNDDINKNNNNNSHDISIQNQSNSQDESIESKEESADYEIDEKNDMIIDKRIKYFLIQLENWLFNEQQECPQIYKEPYIADFFKLQENLDFFIFLMIQPIIYKPSVNYQQNIAKYEQNYEEMNLRYLRDFKTKLKYKDFDCSEYQRYFSYYLKRSYIVMEVLSDFRNYRFLAKKIPKLPYLIVEYYNQTLTDHDKLQNHNHICKLIKKYIKYEFNILVNIIKQHLLIKLINYIDFEKVYQLLLYLTIPEKIERNFDEIDKLNTFLQNSLNYEFYRQMGQYFKMFNFFQIIAESMLYVMEDKKLNPNLQEYFSNLGQANSQNDSSEIVKKIQNILNSDCSKKFNITYISQQRFLDNYNSNKVTKILTTEEQSSFKVDIDRIKSHLSRPDSKFVSKLKETVKKIKICDKFKINNQMNENQKERFFKKQQNIKVNVQQSFFDRKRFSYNQSQINELIQQQNRNRQLLSQKSSDNKSSKLEKWKTLKLEKVQTMKQDQFQKQSSLSSFMESRKKSEKMNGNSKMKSSQFYDTTRQLLGDLNEVKDIYDYTYNYQKFHKNEIVRQKGNHLKFQEIIKQINIKKKIMSFDFNLDTIDNSGRKKSAVNSKDNLSVQQNSSRTMNVSSNPNQHQQAQKQLEMQEMNQARYELNRDIEYNLNQQQEVFLKNKNKAEFIIKKVDFHNDLASSNILFKFKDIRKLDNLKLETMMQAYQFSGIYSVSKNFYDETEIDQLFKKPIFANRNLVETDKYSQECANFLLTVITFVVYSHSDFNSIKKELEIQQPNMEYLFECLFVADNNIVFDRILKNYLFKYKLCFVQGYQESNSSFISGQIVNMILENINLEILVQYKISILYNCYNHFLFLQKVMILQFGQVSELSDQNIKSNQLQLIQSFVKMVQLINDNDRQISYYKQSKYHDNNMNYDCINNNSMSIKKRGYTFVEQNINVFDEIQDTVWDILIQYIARYYNNNILHNYFQTLFVSFVKSASENQIVNVFVKIDLFGTTSKIYQFIHLNRIKMYELRCENINLTLKTVYCSLVEIIRHKKYMKLFNLLNNIEVFQQICKTYKIDINGITQQKQLLRKQTALVLDNKILKSMNDKNKYSISTSSSRSNHKLSKKQIFGIGFQK